MWLLRWTAEVDGRYAGLTRQPHLLSRPLPTHKLQAAANAAAHRQARGMRHCLNPAAGLAPNADEIVGPLPSGQRTGAVVAGELEGARGAPGRGQGQEPKAVSRMQSATDARPPARQAP